MSNLSLRQYWKNDLMNDDSKDEKDDPKKISEG